MEARTTPDGAVLVSADNFIRAESDLYFSNIVGDGGFGKFVHIRELTPPDKQLVIRSNRDTLYSAGVFDLDAGPVTITLPDIYFSVHPDDNDGATVYRLSVGQVPVDGFWSVTVYNKEGYFTPNPHSVYSLNNITAQRAADGKIVIQFGGCDAATANCLPITPGWNYLIRLYRPQSQILSGEWTFPAAEPIS